MCSAAQKCTLSAQDRYDLHIEPGGTCDTTVLTTSTAAPVTTTTKARRRVLSATPAPPKFEQGKKCLFVCDYGYYYPDAANVKMQCVHTEDKTKQFGKWVVVKFTKATTATTTTAPVTTATKAATTSEARRRVLNADPGDSGNWQVVSDALGQCKSA